MVEQSIVLRALEALKKACKELQTNTTATISETLNSPSMKALLELEQKSDHLLLGDPNLSTLSHLLSRLRSLSSSKTSTRLRLPLLFFLRKQNSEISEVAGSIESEIQSWIDRESLGCLTASLNCLNSGRIFTDDKDYDGGIWSLLVALESRLGNGFDRKLQAEILKFKVFESVESTISSPRASMRVKEAAASVIASLVRFNRDVFVGLVLIGPSVNLLVSMATPVSISALRSLVESIKAPIVNEMDSKGEIPRIITLLETVNDEVAKVSVAAMEVVMDMGYYGRKESIETMMEYGVVERLIALQTSDLGGAMIDDDENDKAEEGRWRPFKSCVARFAIQLEVGEGLRWSERSWFKLEILRRVKVAVTSEAMAATISAEVLWGSSP